MLLYRLPYKGDVVAFKMGRRVFSGEAATQESLGRSPRNSVPKKSIALKARFNPAGETPYGSGLVTRFQR